MKLAIALGQTSAAILAAALFRPVVETDEGMWTFDNHPVKQLQEKYNFTPTEQWLDHLRLSCVRLNDEGSGSFVSPHGLLLTNHHVARGQLQKNSSAEHDYIRDGFLPPHPVAGWQFRVRLLPEPRGCGAHGGHDGCAKEVVRRAKTTGRTYGALKSGQLG